MRETLKALGQVSGEALALGVLVAIICSPVALLAKWARK